MNIKWMSFIVYKEILENKYLNIYFFIKETDVIKKLGTSDLKTAQSYALANKASLLIKTLSRPC